MVESILEKSPINSLLVRSLSCLDPRQMALNSFECYTKMKTALTCLLNTKEVLDSDCEAVLLQYSKFLREVVSPNLEKFKAFNPVEDRLDYFLGSVLEESYDKLYSVIKKLLILSHGQADVERGFSVNKLLEIENMKNETFISQRVVTDHLKNTGGLGNFVISKELRLSAATARQKYMAHLEEQKKIKETEVQVGKRKALYEELENLQNKKKRLEDAVTELQNNADLLAEKAENSGEIKYICQSNSFRKSSKEKKRRIERDEC